MANTDLPDLQKTLRRTLEDYNDGRITKEEFVQGSIKETIEWAYVQIDIKDVANFLEENIREKYRTPRWGRNLLVEGTRVNT